MTTGGWIFMVLGMLVLIALVVVLVMWIVSQQSRPRQSGVAMPLGTSAREALDHRLVSGEITPEQYDELRRRLDASAPGAGPPGAPPAAQPG